MSRASPGSAASVRAQSSAPCQRLRSSLHSVMRSRSSFTTWAAAAGERSRRPGSACSISARRSWISSMRSVGIIDFLVVRHRWTRSLLPDYWFRRDTFLPFFLRCLRWTTLLGLFIESPSFRLLSDRPPLPGGGIRLLSQHSALWATGGGALPSHRDRIQTHILKGRPRFAFAATRRDAMLLYVKRERGGAHAARDAR